MGKYFGTDGIRGHANRELDCTLAYKTGEALATMLSGKGVPPHVLIAQDSRISGDMLINAISAGICSAGGNVSVIGVIPTPALAFFVKNMREITGGIMISASHNPFYDNGIKIFGGDGYKLGDDEEQQIEDIIDGVKAAKKQENVTIGRAVRFADTDFQKRYVDYVLATVITPQTKLKALFDCANGATSYTAAKIFSQICSCDFIFNEPNGVNINENCGSTHMDFLCNTVREGDYDIGIAFDGDGDRCLMCDGRGRLIDGDKIMGILAASMQRAGALKNGVVSTVMSNLGFHTYVEGKGIKTVTTQVGDRYVMEEMLRSGHNIGGEQSGHVILSDYMQTGDGQLTALHFITALSNMGIDPVEAYDEISYYPQTLINVSVPNTMKSTVADSEAVREMQKTVEAAFGKKGRVLVRPSGTEPKVRIMVEGPDAQIVDSMAKKLAQAVEQLTAERSGK